MIKVGLIGCGRWGQNHARTLATLPCEFVGLADPDKEKAKLAAELAVNYYEDYRGLLDKTDAVIIAVPTRDHISVVKDALRAGKHVLAEKPLTLGLRGAEALVKLARKKKRLLSVGYIYRFNPVTLYLRERFALSSLSNTHYLNASYLGGQNRLWQDGGAILNFGIHLVDILNFIFRVTPFTVYAAKQTRLDPEHEDSAVMVLQYGDGRNNFPYAMLEMSCIHPQKKRELWIHTENEKIHADFDTQSIEIYDFRVTKNGSEGSRQASKPIITRKEPLREELFYFMERVAGFDENRYEHEESRNLGRENFGTLSVIEAAIRSAKVGQPIITS